MDCRIHRLVADVAPLRDDQVLFVRYRDTSTYDGQRGWFLPDDLLHHEEHPDDAARRIVAEQLGLDAAPRLGFIESFGNGRWHLAFHYVAEIGSDERIRAGENVADARWFDLDALPDPGEMAHKGWGADVLASLVPRGA